VITKTHLAQPIFFGTLMELRVFVYKTAYRSFVTLETHFQKKLACVVGVLNTVSNHIHYKSLIKERMPGCGRACTSVQ